MSAENLLIAVSWCQYVRIRAIMNFIQSLNLGFIHIIPTGLDHIFFIVALSLSSRYWKLLILQISLFTLAHTLSLVLASLEWVLVDASWVEPGIALSIILVSIENMRNAPIGLSRYAWVFAFGLLHGLGFAAMLRPMLMMGDGILIPLVGFNLGVELGQLLVLMISFFCQWLLLRQLLLKVKLMDVVEKPKKILSLLIAFMGCYWLIVRLV